MSVLLTALVWRDDKDRSVTLFGSCKKHFGSPITIGSFQAAVLLPVNVCWQTGAMFGRFWSSAAPSKKGLRFGASPYSGNRTPSQKGLGTN